MKTIRHLFIAVLCLTLGDARAQQGFNLQVIVQPSMSMINGDLEVPDFSSFNNSTLNFLPLKSSFTFGFSGGIIADYHFTDKMGVGVGLLYSHQGQKYDEFNQAGSYMWDANSFVSYNNTTSAEISLNYLKIPIQFNFNTDPTQNVSFSAHAGIYVGMLMNYEMTTTQVESGSFNDPSSGYTMAYSGTLTEKVTEKTYTLAFNTNSNGMNLNQSQTYNLNDEPFNSTDVGGTLGAGIQLKLSDKLYLPLMLNYDFSFSDIKNHTSQYIDVSGGQIKTLLFWGELEDPNYRNEMKNSTFGLRAGLKLIL